jgi:hypothetical protein
VEIDLVCVHSYTSGHDRGAWYASLGRLVQGIVSHSHYTLERHGGSLFPKSHIFALSPVPYFDNTGHVVAQL